MKKLEMMIKELVDEINEECYNQNTDVGIGCYIFSNNLTVDKIAEAGWSELGIDILDEYGHQELLKLAKELLEDLKKDEED